MKANSNWQMLSPMLDPRKTRIMAIRGNILQLLYPGTWYQYLYWVPYPGTGYLGTGSGTRVPSGKYRYP